MSLEVFKLKNRAKKIASLRKVISNQAQSNEKLDQRYLFELTKIHVRLSKIRNELTSKILHQ